MIREREECMNINFEYTRWRMILKKFATGIGRKRDGRGVHRCTRPDINRGDNMRTRMSAEADGRCERVLLINRSQYQIRRSHSSYCTNVNPSSNDRSM